LLALGAWAWPRTMLKVKTRTSGKIFLATIVSPIISGG
jgi:hypothetical protein